MTSQLELDFTPNKRIVRERRVNRPHHRTTTITTTRKTFETLMNIEPGVEVSVQFPNDLISSAKGGASTIHHSIRRVSLLRRQIIGGFSKVKVRCEQGVEIPCVLASDVYGADDDCVGMVKVIRVAQKA